MNIQTTGKVLTLWMKRQGGLAVSFVSFGQWGRREKSFF